MLNNKNETGNGLLMNLVHRIGKRSLILLLLAFYAATSPATAQNTEQQLFELKIYHLADEEQERRTDNYLEKAFLPAMHRMEQGPVGVFKPVGQDTTSDRRIYVLTAYDSFDEYRSVEEQLARDNHYQKQGADYINAAHDNPTFREIETILLRAFSYAPGLMQSDLETPKTERIYELRSYESATEAQNINKVEMFNEGGEVELFDELGFNAIFYGNVIAGSDMPNLMYMISFDNMEARDAHWDQFIESPVWKRISAMEKYQDNVSHIDNYFLHAAEYSDL